MDCVLSKWRDIPWVVKSAGGTFIAGIIVLVMWRKRYKAKRRSSYPQNVVILHQIGRGQHAPSFSPFPLKLETYLRMAKIPYQNVHSFEPSSKGKFPWIEYNGKVIADTEFCITFLNKEKGVNLNSHLTPEENAVGRAFMKMIEENTYWAGALDRWVFDKTNGMYKINKIPFIMKMTIKRMVKKYAHAQGMGRHTEAEVYEIMRLDLEALSNFIGKKKFLLGDKPCHYDCGIFGLMGQLYWHPFGGQAGPLIKEFQILCNYCENMKKEFWPDWDEETLEGQKKNSSN